MRKVNIRGQAYTWTELEAKGWTAAPNVQPPWTWGLVIQGHPYAAFDAVNGKVWIPQGVPPAEHQERAQIVHQSYLAYEEAARFAALSNVTPGAFGSVVHVTGIEQGDEAELEASHFSGAFGSSFGS